MPLGERLARDARFDVVGLGEASWDEVWRVEDAPAHAFVNGKARATARDALGGGQVATALCALSRLGLRAAWHGKLGDDAAGLAILDGLRAEGVDVSGARVVAGAASHSACVLVDWRGDRTVLYHDDERARMTAADVDAALVGDGRVLHVDGNDLDASIAAAGVARAAGRVVSCDLDRRDARTGELLRLVDVAIVAQGLPEALTGEPDRARALAALRRLGPAIACVTLGTDGALACDGARTAAAGALAVARVVDTTACGDTFRAGFLAALLDGRDLGACVAWGSAAAGLKTRDLGRRGCPRRDETARAAHTLAIRLEPCP